MPRRRSRRRRRPRPGRPATVPVAARAAASRCLAIESDAEADYVLGAKDYGIPVVIGPRRQPLRAQARRATPRPRARRRDVGRDREIAIVVGAHGCCEEVRTLLRAGRGEMTNETRSLLKPGVVRDVYRLGGTLLAAIALGSEAREAFLHEQTVYLVTRRRRDRAVHPRRRPGLSAVRTPGRSASRSDVRGSVPAIIWRPVSRPPARPTRRAASRGCTRPIRRRCSWPCTPGCAPRRRGDRAGAVRGTVADADARHAPDDVRRAGRAGRGRPGAPTRAMRRCSAARTAKLMSQAASATTASWLQGEERDAAGAPGPGRGDRRAAVRRRAAPARRRW